MIEPDTDFGKPDEVAKVSVEPEDPVVLTDRRRPGRAEVSPTLLPLLRGEQDPVMLDVVNEAAFLESDWDTEEALKPARGIAYGLLLSLPLWAALLATCHVAIKFLTHS